MGAELLAQLAAEPSGSVEVDHLARRAVEATPPVSVRVVDFAALDAVEVGAAEVGFCALGTTIAKAGSQAAFVQVDRDAVLAYAKLCQRAGAHTFVLVSSLGADPKSRVFYNRIKGEVEAELAKLGFQHLVIVRPSVLDGARSESRPGEAVAIVVMRVLSPLLVGGLRRYRPSPARQVAAAMRALARAPGTDRVRVVEAEEIPALAAG